MPVRRKLCKIGAGIAVFLPKSWVELQEQKIGEFSHVALEVSDEIVITPLKIKKKKKNEAPGYDNRQS